MTSVLVGKMGKSSMNVRGVLGALPFELMRRTTWSAALVAVG